MTVERSRDVSLAKYSSAGLIRLTRTTTDPSRPPVSQQSTLPNLYGITHKLVPPKAYKLLGPRFAGYLIERQVQVSSNGVRGDQSREVAKDRTILAVRTDLGPTSGHSLP